tara:strand:- start:851 stop:1240 length:390 start_codon:yes stop_codon:yes gene_type:complete
VVENFLKNRFGGKYEFFSAGISPIAMPNMHPRSLKYLEENGIDHDFHTPKKINAKMLSYFDKFLAVDFFVLNQLNINYPKYRHKFCSLTTQFRDIDIVDPYRFSADEYIKTMGDIKLVVEKINLEEFFG